MPFLCAFGAFPTQGDLKYRPQNTIVLIMDPPEGAPNFGKPPCLIQMRVWVARGLLRTLSDAKAHASWMAIAPLK